MPNFPLAARRRAAGAVCLIVLAAAGCNRGSTATAEGSVTLDGQPLAGAEVQLVPKDDPTLGVQTATTDASGAFSIRPEAGSNTPLRPGAYTALVRKISTGGNDPSKPGGGMDAVVNELPPLYQDSARSPLSVEIKDGDNQLPPFQLSKSPPAMGSGPAPSGAMMK